MIRLDRRSAITGSMATLAALTVPSSLLAAAGRPGLFIYDSRMPGAETLAAGLQARSVPVLDRMTVDLGHAWRGEIADRLRGGMGYVSGLTLWMDSYICETFGRDHGMAIQRQATVSAAAPWQQWELQMTGAAQIG